MLSSIRGAFGIEEEKKQPSLEDELGKACGLTYEQRLWGFGICFALGWVLSFLGTFFVFQIVTRPQRFAATYTLGSILSIFATAFLFGPLKQIKSMCKRERAPATILYFLFMGLTLWAAFGLRMAGLVILFLILQFLAMVWYTLSYVPYGQKMLMNACAACFGRE